MPDFVIFSSVGQPASSRLSVDYDEVRCFKFLRWPGFQKFYAECCKVDALFGGVTPN